MDYEFVTRDKECKEPYLVKYTAFFSLTLPYPHNFLFLQV
jgi:hypothetical protein